MPDRAIQEPICLPNLNLELILNEGGSEIKGARRIQEKSSQNSNDLYEDLNPSVLSSEGNLLLVRLYGKNTVINRRDGRNKRLIENVAITLKALLDRDSATKYDLVKLYEGSNLNPKIAEKYIGNLRKKLGQIGFENSVPREGKSYFIERSIITNGFPRSSIMYSEGNFLFLKRLGEYFIENIENKKWEKLSFREAQTLNAIFENDGISSQDILILYGYSTDLETHVVETNVGRLRIKFKNIEFPGAIPKNNRWDPGVSLYKTNKSVFTPQPYSHAHPFQS